MSEKLFFFFRILRLGLAKWLWANLCRYYLFFYFHKKLTDCSHCRFVFLSADEMGKL